MTRQVRRALKHCLPAGKVLIRHPFALGAVGAIALFGMVAAFAIAPLRGLPPTSIETVREQLTMPATELVKMDMGNATYYREERIQRSDTISSLLVRIGVIDQDALAFINQNPDTQAFARQLRPGKSITAKISQTGELISLYFPLNGTDTILVVDKTPNGFTAVEKVIQLSAQLEIKSADISSSLFAATDASNIPDAIATQIAEIFSGDIDFYRDLRKGDRFTIVYETVTHNGQHIRSGKILAAEFVNNHSTYQAYWFQAEEGKGGYYTENGTNLRKAFLRSPLEFSSVTSGFSSSRVHPVLQVTRAHRGIDYGAPIGTRVRAVADAIVEFAGRQGGYGNLIILKHQGNYSTAYGHLNTFAPGVRKGLRVSQDDTIGFVGQTGLASGPHLHYEFRINKQQVNPMKVLLPATIPLRNNQLSQFRASTESLRAHLDLAKSTKMVTAE